MNRSWPGRFGQLVLDLFAAPLKNPPTGSLVSSSSPPPETRWGERGGTEVRELAALPTVFSSRLRRSWRLERPRTTQATLHVPKSFLGAPDVVWTALGRWVLASQRPSPGSRLKARQAASVVFEWMGEGKERSPRPDSVGRHHDLQPIFDHLNEVHFLSALNAVVRWSPRVGGLSTHRLVPTTEGPCHLITIGRMYDDPDVPVFALEGVMFHEMLHITHPPRSGRGFRRNVHHADFRRAEKAFPGYAQWREWEIRETPKLLRKMRKRRK